MAIFGGIFVSLMLAYYLVRIMPELDVPEGTPEEEQEGDR